MDLPFVFIVMLCFMCFFQREGGCLCSWLLAPACCIYFYRLRHTLQRGKHYYLMQQPYLIH